MKNERDAVAVVRERLLLPSGYFILAISILIPVIYMKAENLPLVIDLAILSSAFAAVGLVFYFKPSFCITESGKWLPPFNISIIAALCFAILLWALADLDYDIRAPMIMILSSIVAYFSISEGTYLWNLMP